ncbi:uncharacterized protein LOC102672159 isoform X4 [Apis dorsata]|uniref:uncharacterized protein LOC102672159 isoform X4 n=1 Tax=Apis dorsata TaxID=7462 RepID=UPI0003DF4FD5|nr:uncharacterized protein LOC102672159 isoform X4 [Apis dorsata]XP_031367526.1 uncharacterized protein LOC102672159 isoform X4 [Apis dorsata]
MESKIAKQLNIPEWIVNLRHDTAHGYELPSIDVLRIAMNILLTWLHEEYWAAEGKKIEECLITEESMKEIQESEEVQDFSDLIELWSSVSLYIHAGYHLVSNVPDSQLRETLQDLRSYAISLLEKNSEDVQNKKDNYIETVRETDIKKDKKYTLETARIVLLSEISRYLNKKSIPNKKNIVCNTLFNSEIFLPNKDILLIFTQNEDIETALQKNVLPLAMIEFWKDIIFVLYEKDFMEVLIIKLLELVHDEEINKEKRLLASLWISSISYSFLKLNNAHCISRVLEYQLEKTQKNLPVKTFEFKVKEETDRIYPHLKCVLWFNLSDIVLPCLTDIKFISKLILNVNEFSIKFIVPLLELISPIIDNDNKHLLLNLMNLYITIDKNNMDSYEYEKTFILKDIQFDKCVLNKDNTQNNLQDKTYHIFTNENIRNNYWNFAVATYNWAEYPIGLLPWQDDSLEFINPLYSTIREYNISELESKIVPGIIDEKNLKMKGQINWNNILRKKKRLKRKQERRNADVIMNKALETAKKQK